MINKQKMWFITLFSLILILSVYYIAMPSELLTTSGKTNNTNKSTKEATVSVNDVDVITTLQVELDEERSAQAAEYNEILTKKDATTEEKNNAYNGLKAIDEVKAKEEALKKKIKDNLKLNSFIKIDNDNISITIKKQDHNYSLANNIMRLVQEEYTNKVYVSVKFQK